MREKIKAIKQKFRLSMNGVVSQNMREHGMNYKVNFGLTLPLLKRIANETEQDAELAQTLWEETTVRESMMLAPLLYPVEEFSAERANEWVATMPNTEIADMCSKHLFCHTPFAVDRAATWCTSENRLTAYTAFQTATAWLINHANTEVTPELNTIIQTAIARCEEEERGLMFATLLFLKQAIHNNALAEHILGDSNTLSNNLLSILTEEREVFLEFTRNDSL